MRRLALVLAFAVAVPVLAGKKPVRSASRKTASQAAKPPALPPDARQEAASQAQQRAGGVDPKLASCVNGCSQATVNCSERCMGKKDSSLDGGVGPNATCVQDCQAKMNPCVERCTKN